MFPVCDNIHAVSLILRLDTVFIDTEGGSPCFLYQHTGANTWCRPRTIKPHVACPYCESISSLNAKYCLVLTMGSYQPYLVHVLSMLLVARPATSMFVFLRPSRSHCPSPERDSSCSREIGKTRWHSSRKRVSPPPVLEIALLGVFCVPSEET